MKILSIAALLLVSCSSQDRDPEPLTNARTVEFSLVDSYLSTDGLYRLRLNWCEKLVESRCIAEAIIATEDRFKPESVSGPIDLEFISQAAFLNLDHAKVLVENKLSVDILWPEGVNTLALNLDLKINDEDVRFEIPEASFGFFAPEGEDPEPTAKRKILDNPLRSASGQYGMVAEWSEPPINNALNSVILTFSDRDGYALDKNIATKIVGFSPSMPTHRHGTDESMQAYHRISPTEWRVEGVWFTMPGGGADPWVIAISVDIDGKIENFKLALEVQ
jgi:hypothetical protein